MTKKEAMPSAINKAAEYLRACGSLRPRWESEALLGHTLGCGRLDLYTGLPPRLDAESLNKFQGLLLMRGGGWPLQYLIGTVQFMGLEFISTPGVFIPRPETEILVEAVLEKLDPGSIVFDLGTGCGNIAISIAKFLASSRVFASDISRVALDLTRLNAGRHGVLDRVHFLKGRLCQPLGQNKVDIIVSNPPYIRSDDLKGLPPEVKYEPQAALDGGQDGLKILKEIIEESSGCLKDNGYLALEVGDGQAHQVSGIIRRTRRFVEPEIIKDYNRIDRVVIAKRGKVDG